MTTCSLFSWQSTLPHSVDTVFSWHERPGAFERLNAPWRPVSVVSASSGIREGASVEIRLPIVAALAESVGIPWVLKHTRYIKNAEFVDEQVRGPFASWQHRHLFYSHDENTARLEDAISYTLPWWAKPADWFLRRELRRLFAYRHAVLASDLALHARHKDKLRKKVLIAGASGFIGTALSAFLSTGGHTVVTLVRRQPQKESELYWNPERGELDPKVFDGVDVVINLCGENIAEGRWTEKRKERITKSRVSSSSLLATTMRSLQSPPEIVIMASAVGFYPPSDSVCDERSPSGAGFLSNLSTLWERAAEPVAHTSSRLVYLRTGTVLNSRGGALKKMLPAFLCGIGGPLGSGKQWMSWIALQDLLGLVEHIIYTPSVKGPINAVSPSPSTNGDFSKTLGKVLRRPALARVPQVIIKLLFGEMGEAILLSSSRVLPKVALESGYQFLLPTLEAALRFEVGI